MELREWREQMLFAQPPSLSLPEISAKLGGWEEGRMGEGWHLESWQAGRSWVRPGWAVPALAAASPLCHLSCSSPHPLSLFFSFSLSPQQNEKRKTGSSFYPPPTSASPPFSPTTHHTIPPPSHLCSLLLAQSPSFTCLRPHAKTGVI
jgi:hypothetical protein